MKNSINMYRVESIIEGGRKTALILLLGSVISCSVELNEDVGNQKAETLTESEKVTLAVKFDSGVSESGIRANLEKQERKALTGYFRTRRATGPVSPEWDLTGGIVWSFPRT